MDVLPESRELAFERAEAWLKEVQDGKRETTLTQLDAANSVGYKITFGSKPKNTNNFY